MAQAKRKSSNGGGKSSNGGNGSKTRNTGEPRGSRAAGGKDAIALLKADHREVEGYFEEFERARSDARKQELAVRRVPEKSDATTSERAPESREGARAAAPWAPPCPPPRPRPARPLRRRRAPHPGRARRAPRGGGEDLKT
jgi:hypothetical protein